MTEKLICFVMVLCLACGSALQAEDATDAAEIVVLVESLGANLFKARMAAAERLVEIGDDARPVLEASERHPDPEVRQRVVRILKQIKADSSQRRLKEFLANPSRESASKLPGWKRFSAVAGDSELAVACFGRMSAAESELFEDHPPRYLADVLAARVTEAERQFATRRKATTVSFDQLHAFLITSARQDIPVTSRTARSIMKMANQPSFVVSVRKASADRKPTRDITSHWIASCNAIDPYSRLQFSMTSGLKAGLQPAIAILKSRGAAIQKQYAVLAVARLGTIDNVSDIEPLLKDERPIPGTAPRNSKDPSAMAQVRDIALAAAWHLNGERPEDHGFPIIRRNSIYVFAINQVRFESDDQRRTAFKLWQTYSDEQSKN